MNPRSIGAGLAALTLGAVLASCSGNETTDINTNTTAQTTIKGGAATQLVLLGNTFSVNFPANCFNHDTIVEISTEMAPALTLAPGDPFLLYYPTPTHAVGDLITGLVINTPVDQVFNGDLTAKFAFFDDISHTPGEHYILYRFDFDNLVWNRWGNISATVDGGGRTATAVIPTTGLRGFIGAVALFKDLKVETQPAYAPSVLRGTALDDSSNGVATDIGLYFYVGTTQYPVDLPASSGAHVPTGGQYRNTINSAANGEFSVTLPDYLVGQQINVEFGREDANRAAERKFDVLAPISPYVPDPNFLTKVQVLTLAYGNNVIRSLPVPAGTTDEPAIVVAPDKV